MRKIDLLCKLYKGLKNPRLAIRHILYLLNNKLKLTESARVREEGERLVIKDWSSARNSRDFTTLAHVQRYDWVSPHVKNLYCLDDGCGSGYGTYYLASKGVKHIIGIDKSFKAIKYAQRHYLKDNLEYIPMNGCRLSFKKNTFDVVISFDVLEHLKSSDQKKFLSETRRVLKPEGTLYIGCPNASLSIGKNPHHLGELSKTEFEQELQRYYKNVKILGQDILINGIRQKENWYKYCPNLSYQNLIIAEKDCEVCYGLLAICKMPRK